MYVTVMIHFALVFSNLISIIQFENSQDMDNSSGTELSTHEPLSKTAAAKIARRRSKAGIATSHIDLIKDDFWNARPWILGD